MLSSKPPSVGYGMERDPALVLCFGSGDSGMGSVVEPLVWLADGQASTSLPPISARRRRLAPLSSKPGPVPGGSGAPNFPSRSRECSCPVPGPGPGSVPKAPAVVLNCP